MASPSERVLVTGAAGFTGRHLCAHLAEHGYRVFGISEHAVERHAGPHELLQADLLDPASLEAAIEIAQPDLVVHLAAIAFPGHAQADAIYRVNINGSLALLESLTRLGFGKKGVLLPSTGTVYGSAAADALDEDAQLAPSSHYAVSKLAMERMSHLFARSLPIVIVRPFNYTGPGQREPYLVPKIVRHFAERATVIELGNVDVERDFLDVRTVVDTYRRLLESPAAIGQTFNLCSGTGIAIRDIVALLERITGHSMEIRVNPQFVRVGEARRIVGSHAKLAGVIGDLALIPLATTLADMLAEATPGG